jgi:hypothetical protein
MPAHLPATRAGGQADLCGRLQRVPGTVHHATAPALRLALAATLAAPGAAPGNGVFHGQPR